MFSELLLAVYRAHVGIFGELRGLDMRHIRTVIWLISSDSANVAFVCVAAKFSRAVRLIVTCSSVQPFRRQYDFSGAFIVF